MNARHSCHANLARSEANADLYLLRCLYGIYLAHALFVEACEFLGAKLGLHMFPYSAGEKLLVGFFIWACCIAFIALVRVNPVLKYLLLGEGGAVRTQQPTGYRRA